MGSTTEFKILLAALGSSLLFSICHLPNAQYVSDCPGFMHDTELFNTLLLFLLVKE